MPPKAPLPLPQPILWHPTKHWYGRKSFLVSIFRDTPLDRFVPQREKAGNTVASLLAGAVAPAEGSWQKRRETKQTKLLVAHIDTIKSIITKSNSRMAFVTLHDKTGTAEGVVFPETYKKIGALLKEGSVVAIQCTVANRDDRKSILIDNLKVLS